MTVLTCIGYAPMSLIFTFSKQAFNESSYFAIVHNLMEYIYLTGSYQADLPVQHALNI